VSISRLESAGNAKKEILGMMMTFEVKCTGSKQEPHGPHTVTFADGKNQEVKIISAEMPFTIGEVL
jgi:hypothetical protein